MITETVEIVGVISVLITETVEIDGATAQIQFRGVSDKRRLCLVVKVTRDGCSDHVSHEQHKGDVCFLCPPQSCHVRHVTGPFPVSPVPLLTGEVAHRYRF